MSTKHAANCQDLKAGQRSGRYQSQALASSNRVRQPCIRRITATMAMQVASTNDPLHLQAIARPQASPVRPNQSCGRGLRKPCMNDATANRLNANAKISSIAIRDCTNTIWLKKASRAEATAGPCAANSARPQRYIATIDSEPNSTPG